MDILGKQTENKGSLSAAELEEILISSNYNTQGTLSDEESILDRTLTSKDEKYQIPVSEIYNGSLTSTNPDVATDYSDDVKRKLALNLQEEIPELRSPYVQYKGKPYKVLYNDDENGIEIIAMELEETYRYGYDDEYLPNEMDTFETKAKWSYNNLISNLNKKVKELYPSDNVINDARCVGSIPGNKNAKNDNAFSENIQGGLTEGYEYGEEAVDEATSSMIANQPNYTSDFNKMSNLGILRCEGEYLLASRYVRFDSRREFAYFSVRSVNYYSDEVDGKGFIDINDDGTGVQSIQSYIRPVLKLSYGVEIKGDGGDGSYSNPFVLE